MSVNIQTANGLIKISGDKVTKENIKNALGYTPADVEALPEITDDASDSLVIADAAGNIATQINGDGIKTIEDVTIQTTTTTHSVVEHIENTTKHITAAERTKWNNKSDFSGSYVDLTDQPNISEDNSGMIQVADNSGNIILQVDQNGVTTHDVTVNNSTESVSTHHNNTTSHITAAERTKWNNKSDFSGNYTDLVGEPDITEDESAELNIADPAGNIIATVSQEGVTSHEFIVNGVGLGNEMTKHDSRIGTLEGYVVGDKTAHEDVIPLLDNVHNHINDTDVHIQSSERAKWDSAKEIADTINNDYAKGTEFTELSTVVNNHITDATDKLHITSAERVKWNNKSDFSGNYTDLTGEPDIHDDESDELNIADSSGNVIFRAAKDGVRAYEVTVGPENETADQPVYEVGATLKTHADTIATNRDLFDDHEKNTDVHIQSGERSKWDKAASIADTLNGDHVTREEYNGLSTLLDNHTTDDATDNDYWHLRSGERATWNGKATLADVAGVGYAMDSDLQNYKTTVSKTYETIENVGKLDATVSGHIGDTTHLQDGEREKWDTAASTASTIQSDYATGTALDNYKDTVADTYETIANVNALSTTVDNHINDRTTKLHVTSAEKVTWNNKSDFSGNYTDLTGEPDIHDDETDELNITDTSGNVVARIDREGLRTYSIIVGPETATADREIYDVGVELKELIAHSEDSGIHVTATEQAAWNDHVVNTTKHITSAERTKWDTAVTDLGSLSATVGNHIGDATHVTSTEKSTWNGKTTLATVESTYRPEFDDIYRQLVLIGDIREVSTSFISGYTKQDDGSATVTIEAEMFDTFQIYDQGIYNVAITYDEWAGTVADYRILAENTGPHLVKITRKDGSAVTSAELSGLGAVVEHIKNGFSVYFNKLHKIVLAQDNIAESSLTFDTTVIVTEE